MAKRQSTIFGGDVASDGSTSDSSDEESDASIDDSDDLTEEEDEEEEKADGDGDKEGQGNSESSRRTQRERCTQHSRERERVSDGLAGGSKACPGAAAAGSSANLPGTAQVVPANCSSPCDQDTTAAARLPRCKCLVFAQHK